MLLSPVLTGVDGISHASLIDLSPKNSKSVTAAYSPIGIAGFGTEEEEVRKRQTRIEQTIKCLQCNMNQENVTETSTRFLRHCLI